MRLTSTKSTIRPHVRPQTCTNGAWSIIFGSSELALVESTALPQGSRSALASTVHAAPLKLSDESPCSGTVTQDLEQTRLGEHLKPSAGLRPRRRQPRRLGPLDHCAPLTCPSRALLSSRSFKQRSAAPAAAQGVVVLRDIPRPAGPGARCGGIRAPRSSRQAPQRPTPPTPPESFAEGCFAWCSAESLARLGCKLV